MPPPAGRAAPERRPTGAPSLVEGTELLGEFHGAGRTPAPYLVRRADGRMLEVSPALYVVAESVDGVRTAEAVARRVSEALGRPVSAGSVEYLVEQKLRPLGIIATDCDADLVTGGAPAPVLGLTIRAGAVPARVVRMVSSLFRPLFLPPVVVTVLVALVAVDVGLLTGDDVGAATGDLMFRPGSLLVVVCLTLAAGLFHELGHATASRYGGAEPGVIGAGIYLLWPVFYNDLNDSYRLSRGGRLRADLGGVYFNAVFIVALAVLHRATGYAPLLAAIVVQHLAMAQQFLPFVRLDGYYVVSDLAGVPDLFGRVRPTLRRLRRGSRTPDDLTRRARFIVTLWVLATVPLLAALSVALVMRLPGLVADALASIGMQAAALLAAGGRRDPVAGALALVQLIVVAVPLVGLGGLLLRSALAVSARGLRTCGAVSPPRRRGGTGGGPRG